MALNQTEFEKVLKKEFKKLETKFFNLLNDKFFGIYHVQEELDRIITKNIPQENFNAENFKKKIWELISREWAKSLSEQHNKILTEDISKILAKEISEYIKTGEVFIPEGIVITNGLITGSITKHDEKGIIR